MAQHRPTGSETTPPYAPQSSRFGSEPPSVEDDVDVWRYAILELHVRNDDDNDNKNTNRATKYEAQKHKHRNTMIKKNKIEDKKQAECRDCHHFTQQALTHCSQCQSGLSAMH